MLRVSKTIERVRCGAEKPALQTEFIAKIHFFNLLIGKNGLGVSGCNNMSARYYVRVLADIQCFAYVVIGDQYAYALVPKVANDLFNITHRDWIYAGKRLVQQNKGWLHG